MIVYRKMKLKDKKNLREYLLKNKNENAIILYDLEYLYPEKVDFQLALDENNNIKGLNLIWFEVPEHPSVHHRAESEEISKMLISKINFKNNFRIDAPKKYSKVIENQINNYKTKDDLYLMTLNLNNIKKINNFPSRKLSNKDIGRINRLFKGSTEIDEGLKKWIIQSLDTKIVFGCFENGELCSIANTIFIYQDIVGIGYVFTKKNKRGRGFAKSVITSLLSYIRKKGIREAQLYCIQHSSAHRLYKKLNFKEKSEYVGFII